MNAIPKLVFTRSAEGRQAIHEAAKKAMSAEASTQKSKAPLEDIIKNQESWLDPLIASDLVGEIHRQKTKPGKNLIAYGGVTFARELVKNDLVDEYRFVVRPVALGKGHSIFDGLEKPLALKLVSHSSFPSGSSGLIFARERSPANVK